jgi:hypothetical protein
MCLHQDRGPGTRRISGDIPNLNDLCERGRITWVDRERGWVGMPEEILAAFAKDGFQECTREVATGGAGDEAAGGAWRGVNPRMRSMAAVEWMVHPAATAATVFIEIDRQSITGSARS